MPLQAATGGLLRIPTGGALSRECCCEECPKVYQVTIAGMGNAPGGDDWSMRNGVYLVYSVGGSSCWEYWDPSGLVRLWFDWGVGRWRILVYRAVPYQFVVYTLYPGFEESPISAGYVIDITQGTVDWMTTPWGDTTHAEVALP